MTIVIIVEKENIKENNILDINDLYKKCKFKKIDGFQEIKEWEFNKKNIKLFAKTSGKNNSKNLYNFPNVSNTIYGSCALVCYENNNLIDISLSFWTEFLNSKTTNKLHDNNNNNNDNDNDNDNDNKNDNKKTTTTRKSLSNRVYLQLLKEQGFQCRGPNSRECETYQCPMKASKIKFSDIKSPDPEIDHILPLSEEGTNNLENLQILCGCCHNKKSTLEGLMKSNNGKVCPRIISEYSILSKQKYKEEELENNFEESSDSDSDIIIRARRKRLFG